MKDSDIKKSWIVRKMSDICDLQNGYAFQSKTYVDRSNTLNIRMSNIRPSGDFDPEHNIRYLPDNFATDYSQYLLSEGDLVIAMTDMAGEPKILGLPTLVKKTNGRKFLLNQRVGKLCDFSEAINIGFLRYFLSSPSSRRYYSSKGAGGLQINLSKSDILSLPIPLPPLNEQRRIVSTIEQLTDRSNKARAALEDVPKLIAQFRQSVLAAAFRGDLTADWREKNPDVEPASELLERTAIQLGKNYQETRLSISRSDDLLHEKWAWAKFKLFVQSIQAGKNFSCPEIPVTEDTVGIAKISAVTWDRFNPQETKTVTDSSKIDPKLFIKEGDLLISRANTLELVGASVVVEEIDYKIMLSDKVWRINLIDIDKKYVHYYLKSASGRKEIESRANGNQASMRNISQKAFQDIIIPVPPIKEQYEIVRHIEDALDTINSIFIRKQATLEELNQLDRSILAKAFRGELVPQDPNDEPAAVLLERIRAERDRTSTPKQRGKTTRKHSSKQLSIDGIE